MTLDEEISGALTAVESCISRLRSVHELRSSEGKSIAPTRVEDARRLQRAIGNLIQELPADPEAAAALLQQLEMKSRKNVL